MEEQEQTSTKKAWFAKPEMIIALSALLISVVTTVTSIYSTYIDRSYAKASVWPRLELSRTYNDNQFGYILANSGNGPAIIKYAVVKYKGKPIETWDQIPELDDVISFSQSHMGNRVLPSNQSYKPILVISDNINKHNKHDRDTEITLCFCSIYDDCWKVVRGNNTVKVDQCHIPGDADRFRQ
ncbi:hypothetical protein SOPP22_14335 [Shewanella sp. OPT22]|nr:hypothetical protein SOPP22_14335 [Shewanella sp. OPT22]